MFLYHMVFTCDPASLGFYLWSFIFRFVLVFLHPYICACVPASLRLYLCSCVLRFLLVFLNPKVCTCVPASLGLYLCSCVLRFLLVFLHPKVCTCVPAHFPWVVLWPQYESCHTVRIFRVKCKLFPKSFTSWNILWLELLGSRASLGLPEGKIHGFGWI